MVQEYLSSSEVKPIAMIRLNPITKLYVTTIISYCHRVSTKQMFEIR